MFIDSSPTMQNKDYSVKIKQTISDKKKKCFFMEKSLTQNHKISWRKYIYIYIYLFFLYLHCKLYPLFFETSILDLRQHFPLSVNGHTIGMEIMNDEVK